MKYLIVVSLISLNLVPFLSCYGNDRVTGQGKEFHRPVNVQSATGASANSAPRRTRNNRSLRFIVDWRTSYYWHARNTPWWPNAPGGYSRRPKQIATDCASAP